MSIEELKEKYKNASQVYYETGEDILSDEEHDELTELIKYLNPNDPLIKEIGHGYKLKDVTEKERFEHPIDVGSVDKVKVLDKLLSWTKKDYTISTKIDGNSVSCYYLDGKLYEVVTRGTDNIGIIRTFKFNDIVFDNPNYEKVPEGKIAKYIKTNRHYVSVRGEAAIAKSNYTISNGFDISKASRSAVAGAITRKDNWKYVFRWIDFIAYTFTDCETNDDLYNEIDWNNYFKVEEQKTVIITSSNILDIKKKYKDDYEYDADGIVIKNSDGELKAFKFEDETILTDLLSIEDSIGKDQRITPTAILKPVQLSGALISRASLGSYGNAIKLNAYPVRNKHVVLLKRANEIIPNIIKTEYTSNEPIKLVMPKCPVCGEISEQKGEHAFCVNTKCTNIEKSKLLSYSSFHYPEGLSDTTIEKFFDAYAIKSIKDLILFNEPLNKTIQDIGDSTQELFKIFLSNIKKDVEVSIVFQVFLNCCGERQAERIIDSGFDLIGFCNDDITQLSKLFNNKFNIMTLLSNIDSYWESVSCVINLPTFKNLIKERFAIKEFLTYKNIYVKNKTSKIGSFCITKARFSKEQLSELEAIGWKEDKNITKNTTILVTKNPLASTDKTEKAKKYGIRIMGIDEFIKYIKE